MRLNYKGEKMTTESTLQLLSVKAVAELLGLSKRTIHRLISSGKIVAPVKISGSLRFRETDIKLWIQLGCPDRQVFEQQKSA
jgi:excisionase family DNA binding protein